MANYAFIDTGYAVKPSPINTTPSGSQFTRVNSGNEILIKGAELAYDIGAGIDNTSVPAKTDSSGYLDGPGINQVSVPAETFTLTGVVSRKVAADMTNLSYLRLLCKSKGIKLLYYSSATDGYRDMTDTWGETTAAYSSNGGFVSGTTPVLFVRCTHLNVRHTSDSTLLKWTLSIVVSTE